MKSYFLCIQKQASKQANKKQTTQFILPHSSTLLNDHDATKGNVNAHFVATTCLSLVFSPPPPPPPSSSFCPLKQLIAVTSYYLMMMIVFHHRMLLMLFQNFSFSRYNLWQSLRIWYGRPNNCGLLQVSTFENMHSFDHTVSSCMRCTTSWLVIDDLY